MPKSLILPTPKGLNVFLGKNIILKGLFCVFVWSGLFYSFFFFFATFSACDLITGHILILIMNDQLNQGFK